MHEDSGGTARASISAGNREEASRVEQPERTQNAKQSERARVPEPEAAAQSGPRPGAGTSPATVGSERTNESVPLRGHRGTRGEKSQQLVEKGMASYHVVRGRRRQRNGRGRRSRAGSGSRGGGQAERRGRCRLGGRGGGGLGLLFGRLLSSSLGLEHDSKRSGTSAAGVRTQPRRGQANQDDASTERDRSKIGTSAAAFSAAALASL